MAELVFHPSTEVVFATNTFVRTPIILEYQHKPLISVVQTQTLEWGLEIPIYHPDGTYLAKVVGNRVFPTPDGKKAGVTVRHPPEGLICEIDKKPAFEILRKGAAALQLNAELFTFDGVFLKTQEAGLAALATSGTPLMVGGMVIAHCRFDGYKIGVRLFRPAGEMDFVCQFGVNG